MYFLLSLCEDKVPTLL